MSTSFTDASPTLSFASANGHPAPWAETHMGQLGAAPHTLADHGHPLPFAGVAAGWGVVRKIASRREEFCAAFRLVYETYIRAGLSARHPYRMRVTPYRLLPTTEVSIVVKEGEVISTVSLIRDGELGLPMESVYGKEVAWYGNHEFPPIEVSCLAEHPQWQEHWVPVVM